MYSSNINHNELIEGETILKSYPRTIFVELTRRCNMYCTCCRPKILSSKEMDMADEVLDKVEHQLFPTAEVIDFRGWGESTLDDRLMMLINRWENKGKELFIYTNCQTRTPEYWQELFQHNINIAISLRAANKYSYESFMRGASYEKLILHLKKIPFNNKVVLTVVVDDDNINELIRIVELAARYNIKTVHLNPLVQRKFQEDYPTFGVTEDNRKLLLDTLSCVEEKSKRYNIEVKVCADLLSGDKYDLKRCIHPWSYVYISYNGNIGFCDHLMCVDDAVMGNIKNEFSSIWNNLKYQELRKKHLGIDVNNMFGDRIECKWCYKNRYGNWEYLLEPDKSAYDISEYLRSNMERY